MSDDDDDAVARAMDALRRLAPAGGRRSAPEPRSDHADGGDVVDGTTWWRPNAQQRLVLLVAAAVVAYWACTRVLRRSGDGPVVAAAQGGP